MTLANVQPRPSTDPRVTDAVGAIVAALGLKPPVRRRLLDFIDGLESSTPKLPHVSFYTAQLPAGGTEFRATYRIPGTKKYRPRTERLGRVERLSYKRAQRVSEVLQQVKARLMSPEEAHRLLYVDNTLIDKHVEDFKRSLREGGVSDDYLASTVTRLRRSIEIGGYAKLGDITLASLTDVIVGLKEFVEPGHRKKLSSSTINQYLGVLRQFTRWATPTRLALDPLVNSKGVKNLDKVKRRDILVAELAAIVAVARGGTVGGKMPGEDRAMLYLTSFATGLRRKELAALLIEQLKLDAKLPMLILPLKDTKNKKADAEQPLPSWLAADLKAWLGDRRSGPVWPKLTKRTAEVFDRDRAAARKIWIEAAPEGKEREEREASPFLQASTTDGEIVFHSHRHGYASSLVASGLDLVSARSLTRHSTVAMLERYSHTRHAKNALAVEAAIGNPIKPQTKEDEGR